METNAQKIESYENALRIAELHGFKTQIHYFRLKIIELKRKEVALLSVSKKLAEHLFSVACLQHMGAKFFCKQGQIFIYG